MNRVTRLLHKAAFLRRQKEAVAYSKRYVIDEIDLTRDKVNREKKSDAEVAARILEGFDPANSVRDRRILYEVTRLRLHAREFEEEASDLEDGGQ